MSFNTKEYKKILKKLADYCAQEQIRFVLCAVTTKEKVVSQTHLTNQYCLDAIVTLSNSMIQLLIEESYPDEVVSGFKRSLEKSIDELTSIYRQKEALKKESKLSAPNSLFKKGGRA